MSEVDPVKVGLASMLREILSVDVEFEKLSLEDIRKLLRVMTSVPLMSQAQVRAVRHNFNERVMDKPVRELLKPGTVQKELSGDDTSDSGPFGFGVLPGIVKVMKGAEKVIEGEATEGKAEAAPAGSPESTRP